MNGATEFADAETDLTAQAITVDADDAAFTDGLSSFGNNKGTDNPYQIKLTT